MTSVVSSALGVTTVGEAMRPGVVTSEPHLSIRAVAGAMATHGFHTAVIPSRAGSGLLAVTDLELIRATLDGRSGEAIGDVARDPMLAVSAADSLGHAVAVMARAGLAHVLVSEPEAEWPSGVVSSFDVAAVVSGRDPAVARMLRPARPRPLVTATSLSGTPVGDVMHPGLIACRPDTPLLTVAGMMADLRVHCVAVSGVGRRPSGDGSLVWGLVSDMDVVRAAHRGEQAMASGELTAALPVALSEDAPLDRAAALMVDQGVAHLVAVGRTGLPSGVVSSLDVIRVVAAG